MTATSAITSRVGNLSDDQVAAVLGQVYRDIYKEVSAVAVRENGAAEEELRPLLQLDADALEQSLSAQESLALGRVLLAALVEDPQLAPLVAEAMDKADSADEMFVGVVLALGLVVNLTLLVASTEVRITQTAAGKRSWSINKRKADTDLVNAVVKPVTDAATRLPLSR